MNGAEHKHGSAFSNKSTVSAAVESADTKHLPFSNLISQELKRPDAKTSTVKLISLDIESISDCDIEYMHGIRRLSLRNNKLSTLPPNFDELKSLRYLDLHGNILTEIPAVLLQCPKLEILDLSSNNIEVLPKKISLLWATNLKVLSLKNNRLLSIRELLCIAQLKNLTVLEIEGNLIPNEELDAIRAYTPVDINLPKEEYWALAIKRYLNDHPSATTTTSATTTQETRKSKAAKRMGFINTNLAVVNTESPETNTASQRIPEQEKPITVESEQPGTKATTSYNDNETNNINHNNDLYNHSKYNDYFKRLSVLPEEALVETKEHTICHDELILACRKLLFCFTECQQNTRKIVSFCKEKSVAVSIVSLLYSVRSHIDNLVELLQKAENTDRMHDKALIRLCVTVVEIFKQIIELLVKNFKVIFGANDLCFIRMFYMTLFVSYNEMYNAWCYIVPNEAKVAPKLHLTRTHSSFSSHTPTTTKYNKTELAKETRIRSNTLQNRSTTSVAPTTTTGIPIGSTASSTLLLNSAPNGINTSGSSPGIPTCNTPFWAAGTPSSISSTRPSTTLPTVSQLVVGESRHLENAQRQTSPNVAMTSPTALNNTAESPETDSNTPSQTDQDIDKQLYQSLGTVIQMVNVVYDKLTMEISKTALASSTGQKELTDVLITKIRDLTDTCRQTIELSKFLSERLQSLVTNDSSSEKYLTTSEKLRTWESINAFLKSIISILANTKVVMSDMPNLNEIRPHLASLAKMTKDVTVILDLSSYRSAPTTTIQQHSSPNNIHSPPEEKEGSKQ